MGAITNPVLLATWVGSSLYCIFGIVVTELILGFNIGLTMAVLAILLCSWTILEITYYIIRLPDIATSLELELDNILDED
jgi:hypothetical protein